jgi:putative colanic acid biosynthesis UDP-glucose lipid carrier transferase
VRNNDQSNKIIKWMVMLGDFFVLNAIILGFVLLHWRMATWQAGRIEIFILASNLALMLSMLKFSTIIHLRVVGAGEVLKRLFGLTIQEAILTYLLLKVFAYNLPIGWLLLEIGTVFFVCLLFKRFVERWFLKLYREAGRNTRSVTLVGSDPELLAIFMKLRDDATLGYRILGYYGEESLSEVATEVDKLSKNRTKERGLLRRLGSMEDFMKLMEKFPDELELGDELYLCISRKERDVIREVSKLCDHHVVRFYYVPVSVETIGLNLKREFMDDMEIYTTYENPLQNPVNKALKRMFDIVFSLVFLSITALLFPIIYIVIKIQSPGPIFFKQLRTGLDGRDFYCYKFRSMHVNKDADRLQATKDDPRKYPFGNFMRKANIDELPQFWNVLKGDMSIVGPRPHMLAHTEMYSQLIDKYMVRHFVKPGVTGWAQVTGFRGETKELWQMEGRVKRDIWYMEHWSIWLDIRIVWLTFKTIFVHDEHAY